VAVRPYASGGDWDGLRITVGDPAANARVLEVAAALAAPAAN
jgi:histidinol-phosphate aminotransferase